MTVTRGIAVACAVAFCGCTPRPLPHATAADAERAFVALDELQRGRAVVASKCGTCHKPPPPTERSASDWPRVLDVMGPRARLSPADRRLVEQSYVVMCEAPAR